MAAEPARLPADDPGSSASDRGSGSVDDRQLNGFAIFAVSCAVVCGLVQRQHLNFFMIFNVPAGTTRKKRQIIRCHERSNSCEGNSALEHALNPSNYVLFLLLLLLVAARNVDAASALADEIANGREENDESNN
jgi:hypothetical protein